MVFREFYTWAQITRPVNASGCWTVHIFLSIWLPTYPVFAVPDEYIFSIGWSFGRFELSQGQWKPLLISCAGDEVLAKLFSVLIFFTGIVSWSGWHRYTLLYAKVSEEEWERKNSLNLESADWVGSDLAFASLVWPVFLLFVAVLS